MKNRKYLIIVVFACVTSIAFGYGIYLRRSAPAPRVVASENATASSPATAATTDTAVSDVAPAPASKGDVAVPIHNPEPLAEAPSSPLAAKSPLAALADNKPNLWISLGTGFSFVMDQQVSSDQSNLHYESALPNAFSATLGARLGETFGLESSYMSTPGRINSNGGIIVQGGSYQWTTMSLEGIYYLHPDEKRQSGGWDIRFGFQSQSMPFLLPKAGVIQVTENQVDMASIGFDRIWSTKTNWQTAVQLRYDQPFSAHTSSGSGSVSVSPHFSFDGSLTQMYHFERTPFSLGVCWWGQYVDQSFHYTDTSTDLTGTQRIFHSTVEARVLIGF